MDRLMERLGVSGRILPQALSTAATVATSGAVDMSIADKALLMASIGAGTATVGVALQHSTSTVASSFSAFSPALQATGITAEGDIQLIEIAGIDMPTNSRYVRAIVTADGISAANTKQVSALIVTGDSGFRPDSDELTLRTAVASDTVLR